MINISVNKSKPDLQLPNRKLTDATHTLMLRRTYQKKIYGLFNKFDERLTPGLMRMLERNKDFQTEEYINIRSGFLKEFWDKLNQIAEVTISADSPQVVRPSITLAYKAGKNRAVNNPRLSRNSIVLPSYLSRYDTAAIEDLIQRNYGLISGATEKMKTDLLRIMTEGIQKGSGTQEIAREISRQIDEIGLQRAKVIARTEISFAFNNAVSETYQRAGISRWQWLATLGTYSCGQCIANHGQVFEWSDDHPPLHPNCLCTIYPIVDKGF